MVANAKLVMINWIFRTALGSEWHSHRYFWVSVPRPEAIISRLPKLSEPVTELRGVEVTTWLSGSCLPIRALGDSFTQPSLDCSC